MPAIKIDNIDKEIAKILSEYRIECAEIMKTTIMEEAKTSAKELKKVSPVGSGRNDGHYRDKWTYKKTRESADRLGVVVYNKRKYRLTHLLEHSHRLKNGKMSVPIPHIKPVEEAIKKDLVERLKRNL